MSWCTNACLLLPSRQALLKLIAMISITEYHYRSDRPLERQPLLHRLDRSYNSSIKSLLSEFVVLSICTGRWFHVVILPLAFFASDVSIVSTSPDIARVHHTRRSPAYVRRQGLETVNILQFACSSILYKPTRLTASLIPRLLLPLSSLFVPSPPPIRPTTRNSIDGTQT